VYGGTGALFGAMMIGASYLIESPIERLTKVWETDPGMQRMQPSVAPVVAPVQGGLTLGSWGASKGRPRSSERRSREYWNNDNPSQRS